MASKNMESISLLMISTEYPPMPGGVGRYTRNLSLALRKFGIDVLIACNERGEGDFFGLDASNNESSDILLSIVEEVKPDLVHVQLEHGLYGLNLASSSNFRVHTNIDQFYKKCQVPIITTFHSAYPIKQWIDLVQSNPLINGRLSNIPIELSSRMLKYLNRVLTYRSFNKSNREKMLESAASIVFSEYMAKMLSSGNHKIYVIYHGAEPSLPNHVSKEIARSSFSLPLNGKIALALGFETHTKGWEILKEIKIPDNWTIVVNQSRNFYSKERKLTDPLEMYANGSSVNGYSDSHNSYRINNINGKDIVDLTNNKNSNHSASNNNGNNNRGLLELNRGFLTDDAISMLFYASDAVIMPYNVSAGSGVMFDAIAHGLPFVASDLGFFKEFAKKGLGIAVRRKADEFSEAFKVLENDYLYYKKEIQNFKNNLAWDSVARQHISLYMNVLTDSHKDQRLAPKAITRKIF